MRKPPPSGPSFANPRTMVDLVQPAASPIPPPVPPKPAARSAFSTFLSELNPLQYLPVVGTIYRAITGDTIPETARVVGSFVMSGLTGGPVGLAINAVSTIVEKATGIDPDRIGQHLLTGLGGSQAAPALATTPVIEVAGASPLPAATHWSRTQLAAYGVTTDSDGSLRRGSLTGADVLNTLELDRLRRTYA